jgi:hypothetical protein
VTPLPIVTIKNAAAKNAADGEYLNYKIMKDIVGKQVKFTGTKTFWYTNIIEDAEEQLEVGLTYEVESMETFSSWTSIRLKGLEAYEFPHSWFEVIN